MPHALSHYLDKIYTTTLRDSTVRSALYYTVLYCTILCYTVLHCTALYCTVLYVPYCTVLLSTILLLPMLFLTNLLHSCHNILYHGRATPSLRDCGLKHLVFFIKLCHKKKTRLAYPQNTHSAEHVHSIKGLFI